MGAQKTAESIISSKRFCSFSSSIAEQLTCDPKGEFDFNGFSENKCELFPCQTFKDAQARWNKIDEDREKANHTKNGNPVTLSSFCHTDE